MTTPVNGGITQLSSFAWSFDFLGGGVRIRWASALAADEGQFLCSSIRQ